MRFSSIILAAGLALFASAETATGKAAATTTDAAAAAANSAQAAITDCLNKCPAGDVSCTSKCIAVPNPNAAQVSSPLPCPALPFLPCHLRPSALPFPSYPRMTLLTTTAATVTHTHTLTKPPFGTWESSPSIN